MSITNRVRQAIHQIEGVFSTKDVVKVDPELDAANVSSMLARLYHQSELKRAGMEVHGGIRTRYYIKTDKLMPVMAVKPAARKPPQRKQIPMITGKGILGVRVHRLGE